MAVRTNRSKAIHDAIRSFISEYEWKQDESKALTGVILVLYYLDKPGLIAEIANIKHNFRDLICSSLNIYEKENKCMEVIVISGKSNRVKEFEKTLLIKKGIKQIKTTFFVP